MREVGTVHEHAARQQGHDSEERRQPGRLDCGRIHLATELHLDGIHRAGAYPLLQIWTAHDGPDRPRGGQRAQKGAQERKTSCKNQRS